MNLHFCAPLRLCQAALLGGDDSKILLSWFSAGRVSGLFHNLFTYSYACLTNKLMIIQDESGLNVGLCRSVFYV